MLIDPSINCVVFKVKRFLWSTTITKEAETRSEDGIEQAWKAVQDEKPIDASKVLEVYSEWGPSPADEQFLNANFPRADYSFTHARPDNEEDWEDALESATGAMLESMGIDLPGLFGDDEQDDRETQLIPVLRNHDELTEVAVHRPLTAGLAVSLARVAMTDRGTIGIDYVMAGSLEEDQEADELFDEAWSNLNEGLNLEGRETKDGEKMIAFSHPLDHAASAVALPDFYTRARALIEADDFFVAIPDPGHLFLTAANSPLTEKLTEMVLDSDYWGAVALTPACFKLTADGLQRIAERPPAENE